jgi:hypothetical protein
MPGAGALTSWGLAEGGASADPVDAAGSETSVQK